MGHQIIRQPDDLYAVFSSIVDSWILFDCERQDVIDYFAMQAFRDAERRTADLLDKVDADPRRAYHQFTMTFTEANAKSVEHGGEDLSGKLVRGADVG